jgi:hypothetical protein
MICYDVFENISQYLSIDDMICFFMSNKQCYNIYKYNKSFCDIIFIEKIFDYLNINVEIKDIHNYKSTIDDLFKMYVYFKNHRRSSRSDLLVYMIDNDIDNIILFKLIISKCTFKKNCIDEDNTSIRVLHNNFMYGSHLFNNVYDYPIILIGDMKYLLVYSNSTQLDVILRSYEIPISLLSYVIRERLFSDGYRYKTESNKCLKTIVLYFFVKYCYTSFTLVDNIHVHSILISLIRYRRTSVVKYFLYNKRKYIVKNGALDYQYLINKCVEIQDRTHLDLLIEEHKRDNIKTEDKTFIMINKNHILEHCRNSRFKYLSFLVNKYLGNAINTTTYIETICNGLKEIILSKKIKQLDEFKHVKPYIDHSNIEYINRYINFVYDDIKFCKNKRMFV